MLPHRSAHYCYPAGTAAAAALDLTRQIGSSWDEAHALAGLGRCALATRSQALLRQPPEIFQRTGTVSQGHGFSLGQLAALDFALGHTSLFPAW